MGKLKGGLILLVIFIASVYFSFYFEESFRKIIRHLYVVLSNGKISFFTPKKYLHFARAEFVFSFGLFMVTLCFLINRHTNRQRFVNLIFGLFLFVTSILSYCYFDSLFKIIECTACDDGKRQLRYNEINYDLIFISSLVFVITPFLITEIRNFIKIKKQKV